MRYAVVGLALVVAGCGDGPATTAYKTYNECLASKGADGCATEKARFDAAMAFAEGQTRRMAAGSIYRPAPAIETYQPPQQPVFPRSGVICTTSGGVTICN